MTNSANSEIAVSVESLDENESTNSASCKASRALLDSTDESTCLHSQANRSRKYSNPGSKRTYVRNFGFV